MKIITAKDEELFSTAWHIDDLSAVNTPFLYHYRSGKSMRRIFDCKGICFRFTRGDKFGDKMEGKAVEAYYDLAIEDLLKSGKISDPQHDRIIGCRPADVMLTREEHHGIEFYKEKPFQTYVLCFSAKADDPFMYENYVHDKESGSYYCSIDCVIADQLRTMGRKNGVHIALERILYGRDVVESIKVKVLRVLDCAFPPTIERRLLNDHLQKLQYVAKLSKFKKENEIRLIINVPQEFENSHSDISFDEEKEHLTLLVPKSFVYSITPKASNDKKLDDSLFKHLKDNGYPQADSPM